MAAVAAHDGQHRAPALGRGQRQDLVHAAEKAEHHGVIGLLRRQAVDIAAADGNVGHIPLPAIVRQQGQRLLAHVHRRHLTRIGGQRQRQVAGAAARVADAALRRQAFRQLRGQPGVEIPPRGGVLHEADPFLVPIKHYAPPPSAPGTSTGPEAVSRKSTVTPYSVSISAGVST